MLIEVGVELYARVVLSSKEVLHLSRGSFSSLSRDPCRVVALEFEATYGSEEKSGMIIGRPPQYGERVTLVNHAISIGVRAG